MKLATLAAALVLSATPALASDLEGRWAVDIPEPGVVELNRLQLDLTLTGETEVTAVLTASAGTVEGVGSWDPEARRVSVNLQLAPDAPGEFVAELQGDRLVGTFEVLGSKVPVDAGRWDAAADSAPPIVVDFDVEPPVTVSRARLEGGLDIAVMEAIDRVYRDNQIVGLSVAIVLEGELADVRSFGWADFPARTPATGATMYRWASISKPLTAVVALQLAERGALDLDADARELVPEFPEKAYPVTPRQLLCHQAGVVHYRRMGLRTLREYDVEHPWADPIIALDMFNERDLLFEPGTDYHYTTPGYVLLGAVIDRAGEGSYVEQVAAGICAPLGMKTMQPDREWVDIPNRTRGYVRDSEGRTVDTGSDDITWKVAAGGWISTVGDLARFGAGLMGDELLEPETKAAMFTGQETRGGEATGYGLGIGIGEHLGRKVVSHSGAQKKTATYLVVCPEERMAVAVMCNTQGVRMGGLGLEILGILIRSRAN